ncbi:hypothetical protein DACRYDRAFT_22576 [Dacryopinax primogenitus]|uniref:Uncharacterized protein n=1 Tax=Dacryopinax primogenitus (strain DJM 731) TaxID=1858805 RepID=M5FUK3_DACPD|nr:uncharacterized protein DACRYDRAFT_22576 [Dacryopinax primogenitus]EJU01436.1 hypothetical protein DACRYDRAFT_22576 [Dacryopinax primogenitus]
MRVVSPGGQHLEPQIVRVSSPGRQPYTVPSIAGTAQYETPGYPPETRPILQAAGAPAHPGRVAFEEPQQPYPSHPLTSADQPSHPDYGPEPTDHGYGAEPPTGVPAYTGEPSPPQQASPPRAAAQPPVEHAPTQPPMVTIPPSGGHRAPQEAYPEEAYPQDTQEHETPYTSRPVPARSEAPSQVASPPRSEEPFEPAYRPESEGREPSPPRPLPTPPQRPTEIAHEAPTGPSGVHEAAGTQPPGVQDHAAIPADIRGATAARPATTGPAAIRLLSPADRRTVSLAPISGPATIDHSAAQPSAPEPIAAGAPSFDPHAFEEMLAHQSSVAEEAERLRQDAFTAAQAERERLAQQWESQEQERQRQFEEAQQARQREFDDTENGRAAEWEQQRQHASEQADTLLQQLEQGIGLPRSRFPSRSRPGSAEGPGQTGPIEVGEEVPLDTIPSIRPSPARTAPRPEELSDHGMSPLGIEEPELPPEALEAPPLPEEDLDEAPELPEGLEEPELSPIQEEGPARRNIPAVRISSPDRRMAYAPEPRTDVGGARTPLRGAVTPSPPAEIPALSSPAGGPTTISSPAAVPASLRSPGAVPTTLPSPAGTPATLFTPADVPIPLSPPTEIPEISSPPAETEAPSGTALPPASMPAIRISSPYRVPIPGGQTSTAAPPGIVLKTDGSAVPIAGDGNVPAVSLGDPTTTTAPELAERLRIAEEAAAAGAEAQRQYDEERQAREAEHQAALEQERERIRQLEEELANVKNAASQERQDRMAADLERLETERAEQARREAAYTDELRDIKNLLQDRTNEQRTWRDQDEERLQTKETRYTQKLERLQKLEELLGQILNGQENDRRKAEDDAAGRPTLESVLEQLKEQAATQRDLLNQMQEAWRADADRRHFETLEAVRETANQQIPFNVQTYLNDFSKALAAEVRMLLSEVGKLREERRNLQFEISALMGIKAKHGPGGIFQPEFTLPDDKPLAPAPAPAPAPTPPPPPAPAAWHRVHGKADRPRRGKKGKEEAPPPAAAAPPPPPPASWITWQPNPMLPQPAPTAPSTAASTRVPGLFGPRSPSHKDGELP